MRGTNTERQTSCTVVVEINRYGAMTLRSERGRTYQVVGSDDPAITDKLVNLPVGSQVSVTLQQAHGRGNTWRVTDVESAANTDRTTVWPLKR
jgi:hypothetical protein